MDDARRFLRYVVPPFIFLAELALLLVVTQQGEMIKEVYDKLQGSSAGFAALVVVVAGALGYLYSLIHHTLSWLPCMYGLDYTKFVRAAVENQWLTLKTNRAEVLKSKHITREMAWDVIVLLWYSPSRTTNTKDPALGELLVKRTDGMSDLMHGLGTSAIASVFLIPAWMILSFRSLCLHCLLDKPSVIIVTLALLGLHFSNYIRVRDRLGKMVQNALSTCLDKERQELVVFLKDSVVQEKTRRGDETVHTPVESPATESPQH